MNSTIIRSNDPTLSQLREILAKSGLEFYIKKTPKENLVKVTFIVRDDDVEI